MAWHVDDHTHLYCFNTHLSCFSIHKIRFRILVIKGSFSAGAPPATEPYSTLPTIRFKVQFPYMHMSTVWNVALYRYLCPVDLDISYWIFLSQSTTSYSKRMWLVSHCGGMWRICGSIILPLWCGVARRQLCPHFLLSIHENQSPWILVIQKIFSQKHNNYYEPLNDMSWHA